MIRGTDMHPSLASKLIVVLAAWLQVAAAAPARAGQIQQYPLPAAYAWTFDVAPDTDGSMWFGASYPNRGIGHVSSAGDIIVHAVATAFENISGVVVGPDGNVWFGTWSNTPPLGSNGAIARISRSGADFQEFPIPAAVNPRYLIVGPDGNIWFSAGDTALGRITMAGEIRLFTLPLSSCYGIGQSPYGLTVGPDGAIWVAVELGRGLVRFDMITEGFEEVPLGPCGVMATNVAVGPDGNLWLTDFHRDHLYKMTMAGSVTEFSMPGGPFGIVATRDSLFVTRLGLDKVSRIEPETGAVLTDYDTGDGPYNIELDAAGNIWFNEQDGFNIDRLRRPPRCVDSIKLEYSGGTLSMPFALKTTSASWWATWLFVNNTFMPLWVVRIPAVSPAAFFTVPIPSFPESGVVGVLTLMVGDNGDVCGDWKTVSTGPFVAATTRQQR